MSFNSLIKEIVYDTIDLEQKLSLLNGELYLIRKGLQDIKAMCENDITDMRQMIIKKCEELLKGET